MRNSSATSVAVLAACLFTSAPSAHVSAQPAPPQPPAAAASVPGGDPNQPTRLELFLAQPGRVVVRDVIDVGAIEHAAGGGSERPPVVLVQAVVAHEADKPAGRVAGVAVVVNDGQAPFTALFDADEVPRFRETLGKLAATAARLRVPSPEVHRRAVFITHGLEVAVDAGAATGGYLGRPGPDQPSVALTIEQFAQLRELLLRAAEVLSRDARRRDGPTGQPGTGEGDAQK